MRTKPLTVAVLCTAFLACKSMVPPKDVPQNPAVKHAPSQSYQKDVDDNAQKMIEEERKITRRAVPDDSLADCSSG